MHLYNKFYCRVLGIVQSRVLSFAFSMFNNEANVFGSIWNVHCYIWWKVFTVNLKVGQLLCPSFKICPDCVFETLTERMETYMINGWVKGFSMIMPCCAYVPGAVWWQGAVLQQRSGQRHRQVHVCRRQRRRRTAEGVRPQGLRWVGSPFLTAAADIWYSSWYFLPTT